MTETTPPSSPHRLNPPESPSALPEIAEYEARSSRLKNLLLSGNRKNKKKDKKKVNPDKLEHAKFQREVEAGYYNPTQEEVDQLVLIPHFENVHFRNFKNFRNAQLIKAESEEKNKKVPAGLTLEQYKEIQKRASEKAKEIYSKCFPKDSTGNMDRRRLYVDESAANLFSLSKQHDYNMCGESQEVLIKAILQLNQEVEQIEDQNKILLAHLQLLDKAQQMLEVTAKCSIEAIQWEKQKIQEYYEEKRKKEKREKTQDNKEKTDNRQHQNKSAETSPKKTPRQSPRQSPKKSPKPLLETQ